VAAQVIIELKPRHHQPEGRQAQVVVGEAHQPPVAVRRMQQRRVDAAIAVRRQAIQQAQSRQRPDRTRGKAVAARLVAGKDRAIQQQHIVAPAGQQRRQRTAGRSRAHDHDLGRILSVCHVGFNEIGRGPSPSLARPQKVNLRPS